LFVQSKHRSMWKGVLLLTGLVLLLGSGCGGGDGREGDSAAGTHTKGGGEQATTATVKSIDLAAFMDQAAIDYVLAVRVSYVSSIIMTHAVRPSLTRR
jgi:hypothetical protein